MVALAPDEAIFCEADGRPTSIKRVSIRGPT
jgi:hypothetical protein